MSVPTKILIAEPDDFSPSVVQYLSEFADVTLRHTQRSELKRVLEEYDVLWFRLAWRIDESVLDESARCRYLVTPVTGIDHIDEALCKRLGVKIICLRGEREFLKEVRATSELAVALAMTLMRNIPQAIDDVKAGNWRRDLFRGNELYKKTAAVIGFGRLGRIVAQYFKAFGMTVKAYDPRPDIERLEGVYFCQSMEEAVSDSHVVTLHINYTKDTHEIIGPEFYTWCRSDAVLVNTSRGGLLDESALLSALHTKEIKGAALDVVQDEGSFDKDNPLLHYSRTHNNLIIVPHIGGNTFESFVKTEQFVAEKLKSHVYSS